MLVFPKNQADFDSRLTSMNLHMTDDDHLPDRVKVDIADLMRMADITSITYQYSISPDNQYDSEVLKYKIVDTKIDKNVCSNKNIDQNLSARMLDIALQEYSRREVYLHNSGSGFIRNGVISVNYALSNHGPGIEVFFLKSSNDYQPGM